MPAKDCAMRFAVLRSLPLATLPVSSTLSLVTLTWTLSLLRLGSCCSACWICCCSWVVSAEADMLPCELAAPLCDSVAAPACPLMLPDGLVELDGLLCEPMAEELPVVSGVVDGLVELVDGCELVELWLEADGVDSVAAPVELDGLLCEPVLELALPAWLLGCV